MHTLTPESVLAARLGIPRSSFAKWRSAGQLVKEQHYQQDENRAYVLTPEGEAMIELYRRIETKAMAAAASEIGALKKLLNK
jgi:molybdenum-dependent DNA-binding transcriptional regulator ModE